MKILKIMPVILVLSVVSITTLSCRSEAAETEDQVITVQRGDLTVDITTVGNLAFSHKEELTFEIAGTVEEALVGEGDTVEEGQVLAKLDTSEWEEQLDALEDKVTAAERQLATKKRNVTTKELALRQAQIDLQKAEYNLSVIDDVKEAQDAVDDAEYELRFIELKWKEALEPDSGGGALDYWANQKRLTEIRLTEAQKELSEILAGSSVKITTDVVIELETKKLQIEQSQRQLDDAQIAIDDAQMDVEDAQQDVNDAQEALAEARATSTVISAPFAGLITMVNVSTGDVVTEGRVAVILVDLTKFEVEILVNEIDIFNVQLGAPASVEVDAVSGISLPARVTSIAPTAIIQAGVVNYKVTVELESLTSLEPLAPAAELEQPQASQEALYQELDEAVEEGRISQEQADMMKERLEQGLGQFRQRSGQLPEGFSQEQIEQFRQGFGQESRIGQRPGGIMPQAIRLREGLSVTVSVIIEERNDVLLVPNAAITYQGNQTYVQVLEDGVIEQRLITTGISDWQFTEITDGLSEGENVVVPQGTTTTPPTSQQGQRGSGFRMPGVGGFGR